MNMPAKSNSARLLLIVDLLGTFLFGLEGATAATRGNLDLLGLMVLAFATALGGGILRDLLIGASPPNSIRDWRYSATAFLAAAFVFLWHNSVAHIPVSVMVTLDAAGLGLFAVAGAQKAIEYDIPPLIAILMAASPASVEEPSAMYCSPACRSCCARMSTPQPRCWVRPSLCSA